MTNLNSKQPQKEDPQNFSFGWDVEKRDLYYKSPVLLNQQVDNKVDERYALVRNDNDHCLSGILHLFDPSSTTFVKHFICTANELIASDQSYNLFCAGYFNTTTAITRVRFKMSSGNIDAGTIKMYGVV